MAFEFISNGVFPASKYEFVNLLKNTPKNPTDYHDLENILRYRQIMMVKELFGNIRTSPIGSDPITVSNNKAKVTGTWYVDGYRLEMTDKYSVETLQSSDDYFVYVYLRFKEVLYTDADGSDIAIMDEGSYDIIQTSTRFMFDPVIHAYVSETSDVPVGYVAGYKVGKLEWNTGNSNWDYVDDSDFVPLNTKYDEALTIVNNAVHEQYDDTVEKNVVVANRFQTKIDDGSSYAKASLEEVSAQKIRLGFETEEGDFLAAFEMVKDGDEWVPILWMQPGTTGYPISYMSPDGFNSFDNKGHQAIHSPYKLSFGDGYSGFNSDGEKLEYRTGGKLAFSVSREVPDSSEYSANIDSSDVSNDQEVISDPLYGSTSGCRIQNTLYDGDGQVTRAGTDAIYTFVVASANYPSDSIFKLNQKLIIDTSTYKEAIVSATTEYKVGEGSYNLIQINRWILRPGKLTSIEPFLVNIPNTGSADSTTVKVTYSIQSYNTNTNTEALVGFKNDKNVEWIKFVDVYAVSALDVVKINNSVLWVDGDKRLRLKDVSSATDLASSIKTLKTSSAGSAATDPGGIAIGGNDFLNTTISLNSTVALPTYDASTKTLKMPLASESGVTGGLLSNTQYLYILDRLGDEVLPAETKTQINPAKVAFVSKSWPAGTPSAFPYYTSVSAAVNALSTQNASLGSAARGGSVIVYPGVYTGETVDLTGGLDYHQSISIVAIDPKYTVLKGHITDSSKQVNAYIDIPIMPESGDTALTISNASSVIEFGANAKFYSTINENLIDINNGKVIFNNTFYQTGLVNYHCIDISGGTVIFRNSYAEVSLATTNTYNVINISGGTVKFIDSEILSLQQTKAVYNNGTFYARNSYFATGSGATDGTVGIETYATTFNLQNCTIYSHNNDNDFGSLKYSGVTSNPTLPCYGSYSNAETVGTFVAAGLTQQDLIR